MQEESIGDRIRKLREYFGLERKDFAEKIGKTEPTISRAERNKNNPSEGFLWALMTSFSANPDWIMTGEGKMFLTAEDYLEKGIEIFGERKMSEGLIKVFKNPRFTKFHSLVKAGDLEDSSIDLEVMRYLYHVIEIWDHGDEKMRHWLEKQLEMAVREIREKE
jgi:transcriptional regulator with XRE-family HTH domain